MLARLGHRLYGRRFCLAGPLVDRFQLRSQDGRLLLGTCAAFA